MGETAAGQGASPSPGPKSAVTSGTDRADSRGGVRRWQQRTAWARDRSAPLRSFVRTESGSATVLVAGIVAALVWANIDDSSYETVWRTDFSIALGRYGITQDLRTWVNSGLMSLFFLVVGLETRRQFDLGDPRERRRSV